MSTVRLNITLPEELVKKLDQLAGPRSRSSFIAQCIRERLQEIEREQLLKELEEGYKASRVEAIELAEEFETIDLEGWHDY